MVVLIGPPLLRDGDGCHDAFNADPLKGCFDDYQIGVCVGVQRVQADRPVALRREYLLEFWDRQSDMFGECRFLAKLRIADPDLYLADLLVR
jgi:hypothetical protein